MRLRGFALVPALLLAAACGDNTTDNTATSSPAAPTTTATESSPARTADSFEQQMQQGAEEQVRERPGDAQGLAEALTDITGEPVSANMAQQIANVTCLSIDVEPGPGAVDAVAQQTATELGLSPSAAAELVDLSVDYRCPELASK
ncbi:hypothetical protein RR21198_3098 [Rhodococcus rhodochrous ATCC 21198]|uniref:hypothetical protein n=1 Tax=Rhodococcus aetherivorans TaxID=191292 RepID=UPI0003E2136A|nr:hypothetical protein [Rhodococcus aetherivorans]ETT26220.1 hypothetical protein RR21198_3098 [Rhodococcus rhodochrous ATCC 21198]NGP25888.1 hypothetical protein [Rhodococcus aetherivorans]